MKNVIFILAALICAAMAATAQTDLIARIHFLGGDNISASTNALAFTNEFCSPEAIALEKQTLDKLSHAPGNWFERKLPRGAGNGAAQLRPLLDDFLKSEWIFEMRDTTNGSPEYALAIRLSNDRAQLWSTNLQSLLESWTKISTQKNSGGWQLKKHLPPDLFQFSHRGGWVILDCGQNQLPLGDEIIQPFLREKIVGAKTNWLSANLNWPRLAQIFPALREFDFPKIAFQIVGYDGDFHFSGKLNLSQPLPPLENWRVPTNEISQPFDSFTAARGIASWLEKQNWYRRFAVPPQPDQFFIWALPQMPFQIYAAEPVTNADAALAQLDARLNADTNWENDSMMPITMRMADGKISFKVPFMAPVVSAAHDTNGDFLIGGFFPNFPDASPLPLELLSQLAKTNLIFYHWEMTSARLHDLPELTQLLLMMSNHRQLDANNAAAKLLKKIEPALGQTVTTATEISPAEISFVRTAPGGLTAIEFLALANWLDSPKFPSLDLRDETEAPK